MIGAGEIPLSAVDQLLSIARVAPAPPHPVISYLDEGNQWATERLASNPGAEVIVDTTTLVVVSGVGLDVSCETIPYVAGCGESGALEAVRSSISSPCNYPTATWTPFELRAVASARQGHVAEIVESGSLERRDSGPRDCCCFVNAEVSGVRDPSRRCHLQLGGAAAMTLAAWLALAAVEVIGCAAVRLPFRPMLGHWDQHHDAWPQSPRRCRTAISGASTASTTGSVTKRRGLAPHRRKLRHHASHAGGDWSSVRVLAGRSRHAASRCSALQRSSPWRRRNPRAS